MKTLHAFTTTRRIALTLLSLIFCALCAFSPAGADPFDRLNGSWRCQEAGLPVRITFVSPQQLHYNGQPFVCRLSSDMIQVQTEYGVETYFFTLQEGVLIILSAEGDVIQCQKAAEAPPTIPEKAPDGGTAVQSTPPGSPAWPPPYARPQGPIDEYHPDAQALLYKFAGRWDHYSNNRLTNLFLRPDGTYEETFEAGFSGEFTDQGGYQTGSWNATGMQQGRGTWQAVGGLRQGKIYLKAQNGRRDVIDYRVHIKNGEVYWGEYFFNGRLYSVEYIYR